MSTRVAPGAASGVGAPAVRSRLRALEDRPVLVVGAIFLVASLLGLIWTLRITGFNPDELVYTKLAINMGDEWRPLVALFPGGEIDRLNQLYPLLIAPLYLIWGNAAAYDLAHVWNSVIVASTAIPAYLLSREVVDRRGWGYLVAALTVVMPWVTVANNLVTEVATYPTVMWACLAMQRAIVAPSPRRDVLAVLAIGLAAFARLQYAVLLAPFVAGVLAHELGWALLRPAGLPRGRAVLEAAKRAIRAHVVLVVAAVLAVIVLVLALSAGASSSGPLGFYNNTLQGSVFPAGVWDSLALFSAFIFIGMGVIPAVLALGWGAVAAFRPVDKRMHAFAVLLLLTVAAVLYQGTAVSVKALFGILQERYVFAIAPLLLVGMVAFFADRRRISLVGVAGAGLLVAWLISISEYELAVTPFWFYAAPALAFFRAEQVPVLDDIASFFGLGWSAFEVSAALALLVTAVVVVLLALVPRSRRAVIAVVAIAVAAFCVVETRYVMEGMADGYGDEIAEPRDWVDRRAPAGEPVGVVAEWTGDMIGSREKYLGLEYWNRSIKIVYSPPGTPPAGFTPPFMLDVDWRTGEVKSPVREVPYLVVSTHQVPLALQGRPILLSPERPNPDFMLMRARVPYRAAWYVRGLSANGWLPLDRSVTARFYRAPGSPECRDVSFIFEAPRGVQGLRTVVASRGGVTESTALSPGTGDFVAQQVCYRPGERAADVTLRVLEPRSVLANDKVGVRLDRIVMR